MMPKTSMNALRAPAPPEQRSFKARGGGDEQFIFEIYQRQNIQDEADFSCGIVHVALDGTLACLLEDFSIAGLRAEHDHPRLPL